MIALNKEKLRELMKAKTGKPGKEEGNYCKFARMLGVTPAHLWRLLTRPEQRAGVVFLGKLADYCREQDLDIIEYIFLE
jgi:hypothetical protein